MSQASSTPQSSGLPIHPLGSHFGEPQTDLEPLRDILGEATIVALGGTTRASRELAVHQHRLMRFLISSMGFRSIVWEEDWSLSLEIDRALTGGPASALRRLLRGARPFWGTEPTLTFLEWVRAHNRRRPDDQVRLSGVNADSTRESVYEAVAAYLRAFPFRGSLAAAHDTEVLRPRSTDISDHVRFFRSSDDKKTRVSTAHTLCQRLEESPETPQRDLVLRHARAIVDFHEYHSRQPGSVLTYATPRFAEHVAWWQKRTGHRTIFWGGVSNTVRSRHREISIPPVSGPSVGGLLDREYGGAYRTGAFTFERGLDPVVPPPAPGFSEAALSTLADAPYLLDLGQRTRAPAWVDRSMPLRVLSPSYDPARDSEFAMRFGSLRDGFDFVVHVPEVTAARRVSPNGN